MKKLIASDYDGTLNQGGIPEHVAEAIERFRATGHLFGVSTGRSRRDSFELFRAEGRFTFDFVIALNGAQIYDGEGNLLFDVPIQMDTPVGNTTLAKALAYRMGELGCTYIGFSIGNTRQSVSPKQENGKVRFTAEEEQILSDMTICHMLNTFLPEISMAERITQTLQEEFGTYVNPMQNGVCIDIPVCGMDKAVGIARYAAMMGVEENNIWTAGDNYNDIPMLKRYIGCAMECGCDAAKAEAKYICRDVADVAKLAMSETQR
ncbi:MAG: HAD hydrolase family protein [Clostridia bacterium]|nr:HAD hydrolase family protein [Clostridia bacterium]